MRKGRWKRKQDNEEKRDYISAMKRGGGLHGDGDRTGYRRTKKKTGHGNGVGRLVGMDNRLVRCRTVCHGVRVALLQTGGDPLEGRSEDFLKADTYLLPTSSIRTSAGCYVHTCIHTFGRIMV